MMMNDRMTIVSVDVAAPRTAATSLLRREVSSPTREEIHALVGDAPSLRYLSEMNEGPLRSLENQWHRIYIGWHAILGQLKVRQRREQGKSAIGSMFRKRKK